MKELGDVDVDVDGDNVYVFKKKWKPGQDRVTLKDNDKTGIRYLLLRCKERK